MFDYKYKSNLLVEQHFHGLFGCDFSFCTTEEILKLSKDIVKVGIGGFYPTLVTDNIENINRQISRIKSASLQQEPHSAKILGIHLEGIFINPEKKGIHDAKKFLPATIENYKLIEDDFIKIVTLAPELDEGGDLRKYLISKGIKVQAGHCVGGNLDFCTGATHTFNAMSGITHRGQSTALSALINDDIYTEIIADGIHLSDEIIELVFRSKPSDKIILVSDSLPLTKSNINEMIFAGEKVYYDGSRATSAEGTIAGSTAVINEIVKRLSILHPENFEKYVKCASDNVCNYHGIHLDGAVYWDKNFDIVNVKI